MLRDVWSSSQQSGWGRAARRLQLRRDHRAKRRHLQETLKQPFEGHRRIRSLGVIQLDGPILSGGGTDEAYAVAVRVADDKVSSAPRLRLELLVERPPRRDVLRVERFHVLDLDEGGNESIPVLRAKSECGLVHEFEMYTST